MTKDSTSHTSSQPQVKPLGRQLGRALDSVGCGPRVEVEVRLFRLITLTVWFLCLFCILPSNLLQELSPCLTVITTGYGIASYCFYFASRRGHHFLRTYYALTIVTLNACWFLDGGSAGSVVYYFFPALLFPLFFFRGLVRGISILLLVLDNWALLLVQHFHPLLVLPFGTATDRAVDLGAGFCFSTTTCAVVFYIVVHALERELTERRHAQELLVGLNRELDLRVKERTLQLEEALREQEAFSYSVSHDLRAPLRHMNSYLTILAEEYAEGLPVEALAFLDRARNASGRMGKLIDDLMELSRVSRSNLVKEPVDLSELAAHICERFSEAEPCRAVEVVISAGQSASGDKTLFLQMLENLLGNAWKYTSASGGARIEFGRQEAGGAQVFYVRDNGVGFDMTYRDMLFRPFQRLHGAEYEGNGVGLATVKRIVERHGGEIWADGSVDQGATFYFTLPPAEAAP